MIVEYLGKRPLIGKNVYIAPTAAVIGDVTLADGVSVWFGAVLRGDEAPIRVGKNSNIQDNVTVHTDIDKPAIIGNAVTVGHNAVVHGCTIEDGCLIGIAAIVLNDAYVATGTVIAAGALVREGQQAGPHALLAGVPAMVKRQLDPAMAARLQRPVDNYLRKSMAYATSRVISADGR